MSNKTLNKELLKSLSNKKVILLDIEGTTTSINFVREVLFTKARSEVERFLLDNYEDEKIAPLIEKFKEQIEIDIANEVAGATPLPGNGGGESSGPEIVSSLTKNFLNMMDADRKLGPLKALQGAIWKGGYQQGHIKGHVYPDVVPALKLWKGEGKSICIYSSGSVQAQKMLFGHSEEGDILHFFSHHFDTAVGLKTESSGYESISKSLKVEPNEVLFITDVEKEALAASGAGMDVVISIRPGNDPLSPECRKRFPTITSFAEFWEPDEVCLSSGRKRSVSEVEEEEEKVSSRAEKERKKEMKIGENGEKDVSK